MFMCVYVYFWSVDVVGHFHEFSKTLKFKKIQKYFSCRANLWRTNRFARSLRFARNVFVSLT